MNKPILFILYISFACCIGFIGGMFFGGFYNQNIVAKTVSEYNEVQDLMEWYKLIIIDQIIIEDLETINNREHYQFVNELAPLC